MYLKTEGLELGSFILRRPTNWSLTIEEIKIRSATHELTASNIHISPPSPGLLDFAISTHDLSVHKLQATPGEELTLALLWGSVASITPLMPREVVINKLTWCEGDCIVLSLLARRSVPGNRLDLTISQDALGATLSIEHDAMSLTVAGTHQQNILIHADLAVTIIEDQTKALFISSARARTLIAPFIIPATMVAAGEAEISGIEISANGALELDTIINPAKIFAHLESQLAIKASSRWSAEFSDAEYFLEQPVAFGLTVSDDTYRVTLELPVTIYSDHPNITKLTVQHPSYCQLDSHQKIDCEVYKSLVSGNLQDMQWSTEFDLIKLSAESGDWLANGTATSLVTENTDVLVIAPINFSANNNEIAISSNRATIVGVKAISAELSHQFENMTGRLALTVNRSAAEMTGLLSYLELDQLVLDSGHIDANFQFDWRDLGSKDDLNESISFRGNILATEFNLLIDDYLVSGGQMSMKLTGWPQIETSEPAYLKMTRINLGFPLRQVDARFNLSAKQEGPWLLHGQSLSAELLGGTLYSDEFHIDLHEQTGDLRIDLEQLNLSEILTLHKEGLSSSGKISGSVPIHIQAGKLSVSQGKVSSINPGGVIRYVPEDSVRLLADKNEQLKTVLGTLTDFKYKSLSAILEYSSAGTLSAQTQLKGSNPAFKNGRQINLNLNLEENVADLLKSLRLTDDVTRKISHRPQKK